MEINNLYRVEGGSGLTTVGFLDQKGRWLAGNMDEMTSTRALGIIQLVTAWQKYTGGALHTIGLVGGFIQRVEVKGGDNYEG